MLKSSCFRTRSRGLESQNIPVFLASLKKKLILSIFVNFLLIFLLPMFDQFLSIFDRKLMKIDQKLVAEKSTKKLTKIDKMNFLFN